MSRATAETLLLSAILNSGNSYVAEDFGITSSHFKGYQEHFNWLMDYTRRYGTCPSVEEMRVKFPDFTYSEDQFDPRPPAFSVKRDTARREMTKVTMESMKCLRADDVEGAYSAISDLRLDLTVNSMSNSLVDAAFLDDYDEPQVGRINAPWKSLQGYTNGIGPGELFYLAARQGQGKSSLLVDWICQALMDGNDVGMYSLEMNSRSVLTRVHANLGNRLGFRVDQKDMLHRRYDKGLYKEMLSNIESAVPGQMFIHDANAGPVTPAVIASNASKYQLNVIDYVGLMRNNEGRAAVQDWRIMAEISNELKQITTSRNTAILGAVQVNREGDTLGSEPPRLKNLAQSDHLGNDGDAVITMKRVGQVTACLSLEKNRNAESMVKWWIKYDPNHGDFSEITYDQAQELIAEQADD